jgi:hypothetical protein
VLSTCKDSKRFIFVKDYMLLLLNFSNVIFFLEEAVQKFHSDSLKNNSNVHTNNNKRKYGYSIQNLHCRAISGQLVSVAVCYR